MVESSTLNLLIQGGAVGISILLIFVVYKLVSNHDKHLLDALERNTAAWNKNAEALTALSERIKFKN